MILARIFRRGDAEAAPSSGMPGDVRPDARCWDAMGIPVFCGVQIGFAIKQDFSLCTDWQKHGHGEISGLGS